ncbi:hypothetical protein [Adonisia turfae]|uniref:hypothetical protein n=1 Tax=Adonisia turfae TaxID=2950184 RepID=UPI0013D59EB0|nr:hypothetical protein [Adonisia turfae]
MNSFMLKYPLALGSSVYIAQLLVQPAFAHANHDHSRATEQPSVTVDEANKVNPDDMMDMSSDEMPMDATEMPMHTTQEPTDVPVVEVAPSVSQAKLLDGFSIGLGEALLGLILVGPFLLMSLKKRL